MGLRTREAVAVALVVLMTCAAPPAAAEHAPPRPRSSNLACPATVPEDGAADVPASNVHEAAIDCAAWWQVALGTDDGIYAPSAPVTRAQMASFVGRVGRAIGLWQWHVEDESNPFPDNGPGPHQYNVTRLARMDVVRGQPDGRFHPHAHVTRAQMATFVARTLEAGFVTLPGPVDAFHDDDGSVHEDAIGRLAAAGIVGGTADGSYQPDAAVPRDQMASFLTRALDLAIEQDRTWLPGGGAGNPSAYRWRFVDDEGRAIRFDPCEPIRYIVNARRAPATGLEDLHEAFRRIGEVTGIDFYYDGPSDDIPDTDWFPGYEVPPTILVGWVTAGESDFLADGHGGHGSPIWTGRYVGGELRSVAIHGFLALGADDVNRDPGYGPGFPWGALLLQQLANVLGLGFGPDDDHQIMRIMYLPSADFGAGDLEGLRLLGRDGGCLPADE